MRIRVEDLVGLRVLFLKYNCLQIEVLNDRILFITYSDQLINSYSPVVGK